MKKDIGIAIVGHGFMGHEHEKMLLDCEELKQSLLAKAFEGKL